MPATFQGLGIVQRIGHKRSLIFDLYALLRKDRKYLKVISGDVKYYEEKEGAVMEQLFRYIRKGLPEDVTFELDPSIKKDYLKMKKQA